MAGEEDACLFLIDGRCSIHGYRPGICRLFPLGRNYEGEKMSYFLLTDACPAKNKSKMKVSKWLEMDGVKDYEHFLVKWHSLTKSLRQTMQNYNEEEAKRKNMLFLQMFYFTPVQQENFYDGFYERLEQLDLSFAFPRVLCAEHKVAGEGGCLCQLSLTRITHQVSRAFDLNSRNNS